MPHENAAWLAGEFASQISQVLKSTAGESPKIDFDSHQLSEDELRTGEEEMLWWEQPFGSDAVIWAGASARTWEGIGGRVPRGAATGDEQRGALRSAYLEIIAEALSRLAGPLSSRVAKDISSGAGREAAPAEGNGYSFKITLADPEAQVFVAFSQSLLELLGEPASSTEALEPPGAPDAGENPEPVQPPNPIDLLLDVELPVSISFGRAQLALKDIIKLTTGSIVELNRSVSEPVEVIINNCVIARGEVVVVEGNFGIRIKQVISRQERLRTLN